MNCYRFIAAEQSHYPVQVLYRVLGVVPSCYYAWYQRQAAAPEAATCFEEAVKAVFYDHTTPLWHAHLYYYAQY